LRVPGIGCYQDFHVLPHLDRQARLFAISCKLNVALRLDLNRAAASLLHISLV
jgi:hypothetical protein